MSDITTTNAGVPDYLREYKKTTIGNVDSSDRVIPRVKLIQAISPELQEFPEAKAGQFWHAVALQNLGPKVTAIPILINKSYVLWAPRGDERGILARARDGIHWDQPNAEFTVRHRNSPNSVTYNTRKTVAESKLDQFGSSIPGDPNSAPAASLTYNMMWYLVDFPELSPSIIINTRSSVKPMQQLLSRIDSKPVPHYVQKYDIMSVQQKGAEGPYFNFSYIGAGFADESHAKICATMYESFSAGGWVASDESEEAPVFDKTATGQRMADKDASY